MHLQSDLWWLRPLLSWGAKALLAVVPVAAAFIGVVLTNRTNLKINQQKFAQDTETGHRERAEELAKLRRSAVVESGSELYGLLESWSHEVAKASTMIRANIVAGLDLPAEHLQTMRESTRVLRAKFLVQVYFPDLDPLMLEVGNRWIRLGQSTNLEIRQDEVIDEVVELRKEFRLAALKLEHAIIEKVRENT